jgi:YidC/Oxa1 family membrane protein insertase
LLSNHAAKERAIAFLSKPLAVSFGESELFGIIPIKSTFVNADGRVSVMVTAAILVVAMTATTFTTQRQLMSKNMPADAMSGPYAQQQKILLYVLPLVFAVGGVAFPIGVLFYWTISNVWTMGQQFYVIRNNPAPGTAAEKAKQERDRVKAARKGGAAVGAAVSAPEEADAVAAEPASGGKGPKGASVSTGSNGATDASRGGSAQRQRQQPQRQSRQQRKKKAGQGPASKSKGGKK